MDDRLSSRFFIIVVSLILGAIIGVFLQGWSMNKTHPIEITTAKPIYQQRIGDEVEPDILIIYEAEVDGVKVYPSVVKEAK